MTRGRTHLVERPLDLGRYPNPYPASRGPPESDKITGPPAVPNGHPGFCSLCPSSSSETKKVGSVPVMLGNSITYPMEEEPVARKQREP